jgi:putative sterol carrier protein
MLVHGLDIARVERVDWPISAQDAHLMNAGATHLLPYFVNDEAAGNLTATYRIHLRGGDSFLIVFDDGELSVQPDGSLRPDCIVSIDPVTWQLVGYGRVNQFVPALTGKMFVYGRKPWLALKLGRAFSAP